MAGDQACDQAIARFEPEVTVLRCRQHREALGVEAMHLVGEVRGEERDAVWLRNGVAASPTGPARRPHRLVAVDRLDRGAFGAEAGGGGHEAETYIAFEISGRVLLGGVELTYHVIAARARLGQQRLVVSPDGLIAEVLRSSCFPGDRDRGGGTRSGTIRPESPDLT